MKKEMLVLSTTFALTACLGLAACGGTQQAAQTDSAAATTETTTQTETPAAKETTTEAPAEKTTTEAPAAQTAPAPMNSYIGNDAALDAALKDAGISKSDAAEIDVALDTDDGTTHYDVEFKNGGNEYDYDIDAANGNILSKEVHADD